MVHIDSQFYEYLDGGAMRGPASQYKFICRLLNKLQYLRHYTLQKFGNNFLYSILKRTHLEKIFRHINNLHQNIKFSLEEESNEELAFLDILLKWNSEKISLLVYRKPTHTDQYLH